VEPDPFTAAKWSWLFSYSSRSSRVARSAERTVAESTVWPAIGFAANRAATATRVLIERTQADHRAILVRAVAAAGQPPLETYPTETPAATE
jgi:hypothetical protein